MKRRWVDVQNDAEGPALSGRVALDGGKTLGMVGGESNGGRAAVSEPGLPAPGSVY